MDYSVKGKRVRFNANTPIKIDVIEMIRAFYGQTDKTKNDRPTKINPEYRKKLATKKGEIISVIYHSDEVIYQVKWDEGVVCFVSPMSVIVEI